MCSFVKLNSTKQRISAQLPVILEALNTKGGDEYTFVIEHNGFINRITNDELNILSKSIPENSFKDIVDEAFHCLLEDFGTYDDFNIIAFSRLTPEMEETNNLLSQPYVRPNGDIIVAHGTIPKAEELAKQHGISITVDTDLFFWLDFKTVCDYTEVVGGKISAMICNAKSEIKTYQNGLGLYGYKVTHNITGYSSDYISNIDYDFLKKIPDFDIRKVKTYDRPEREVLEPLRLISLFSGGLDITCATQKAIEDLGPDEINLWYFDWGTNAASAEIEAGWKFMKRLKAETNITEINHETIKTDQMFRGILSACDMNGTRLTDDSAVGAGEAEAEAAISYVPYRNTFLITLAAARAEQMYPNERIAFVIGANLSEGMVYLDNSETWLHRINAMIKVGGQNTIDYSVIAPYVNRTKTAMVKDAIDNNFILDTSFSCYFPTGITKSIPCGKCGSCLLKENALSRAEGK